MKHEYINPMFFKFDDGEPIAIWKDEDSSTGYMSYMHIGQHGEVSADLMDELDITTDHESLARELKSIGYMWNNKVLVVCVKQDQTQSKMFTVGETYEGYYSGIENRCLTVRDNYGRERVISRYDMRFSVENNSTLNGDDIRHAYFQVL